MTYIVGVDTGGTHTNIRVVSPDGIIQNVAEINKSLTSNRSDEELREVCAEIIRAIEVRTLGASACIWINAAGYSAASRRRLEEPLGAAIAEQDLRVGISNDAVGLLLAHDSELVVTIAGTGSVTMARDPSGQVISRGGDEWVVADYGSAFWLGLEGIRAAYRAFEGGPATALKNCLMNHFEPRRPFGSRREESMLVRQIARDLASLGTDTKPTVAGFAPEVTRQAELGDDEAQKIVRRAADELAASAARVYRELAAGADGRIVPTRFLLSGSVGYRSQFYFEAFRASLDQFLFDVREATGRTLELELQLNGLADSLIMAQHIADDRVIANLDELHPFVILTAPHYSGQR